MQQQPLTWLAMAPRLKSSAAFSNATSERPSPRSGWNASVHCAHNRCASCVACAYFAHTLPSIAGRSGGPSVGVLAFCPRSQMHCCAQRSLLHCQCPPGNAELRRRAPCPPAWHSPAPSGSGSTCRHERMIRLAEWDQIRFCTVASAVHSLWCDSVACVHVCMPQVGRSSRHARPSSCEIAWPTSCGKLLTGFLSRRKGRIA